MPTLSSRRPNSPVTEPASHPLVIAIDGPAGAGKSTVAKALALRLGVPYLDTGAMYRAIALLAMRHGFGVPLSAPDGMAIARLAEQTTVSVGTEPDDRRVMLDGEDVTAAVRTPECSQMASAVSVLPEIRRIMVALQRRIGEDVGGVLEGRDIGSVVFPDASLKVFLTATPTERARRRAGELRKRGHDASFEAILEEQRQRDLRDTTRSESPLHVARGSVVLDSTGRSVQEVIERIVEILHEHPSEQLDSQGRSAVRSRNHGS